MDLPGVFDDRHDDVARELMRAHPLATLGRTARTLEASEPARRRR